jgi:hypothetical protein
VLNLLISRRTRSTAAPRRFLAALTGAVRSVVAPAGLVREQTPAPLVATPTPVAAPDPTDTYTPDELPAVAVIEAAAAEFERAADEARRGDRGKRAAKKVLDRLPAGLYGTWLVSRTPSSRQTADLDQIRATYAALGLGPVPMKDSAPSLKVARVEAPVSVAA